MNNWILKKNHNFGAFANYQNCDFITQDFKMPSYIECKDLNAGYSAYSFAFYNALFRYNFTSNSLMVLPFQLFLLGMVW